MGTGLPLLHIPSGPFLSQNLQPEHCVSSISFPSFCFFTFLSGRGRRSCRRRCRRRGGGVGREGGGCGGCCCCGRCRRGGRRRGRRGGNSTRQLKAAGRSRPCVVVMSSGIGRDVNTTNLEAF